MTLLILRIAASVSAIALAGAAQVERSDVAELTRLEAIWNDAHIKGDADALDHPALTG